MTFASLLKGLCTYFSPHFPLLSIKLHFAIFNITYNFYFFFKHLPVFKFINANNLLSYSLKKLFPFIASAIIKSKVKFY
nr:MAG TPA: hypothetical protein [Caudoviricetes sp.]